MPLQSLTLLEDDDLTKLSFEIAVSARLIRVYEVIRGRNAWWSTWVTHYYPRNFHLTQEGARSAVEKMRERGSTWTLRELPACAFAGDKIALIVTEINSSAPLKVHSYGPDCPPYMESIGHRFRPVKGDSILRFSAPAERLPESADSFRVFRSTSIGGQYPLAWTDVKATEIGLRYLRTAISSYEASRGAAFLGISYEEREGRVVVSKLHRASPLRADDLQVGDVIEAAEIEGRPEAGAVSVAIEHIVPGDWIRLAIARGNDRHTLRSRVGSFEQALAGVRN